MNLFQLTLRIARIVTDVLDGIATTGTVSNLADPINLNQPAGYWDRGTLWMLSGSFAGQVIPVETFAASTLNLPTLSVVIARGDRYALTRHIYPYQVLVSKVNAALDETYVVLDGSPVVDITGDGETLTFDLPDGVSRLAKVEIEDSNGFCDPYPSTHWEERDGQIIFGSGYAPWSNHIIHPFYRSTHTPLVNPWDELDPQINGEWLVWKAAEYVLYWGVQVYGEAKEYRIEEILNRVLMKQKGMYPRKPVMIVKTAGG